MNLPSNFVFSQSSLQSYQNCPRQFFLRYIEHLSWPAQETSAAREFEDHLQRGNRFHNLIHQFFVGITLETIEAIAISDPSSEIWEWWQKFKEFSSNNIRGECFAEFSLQTSLLGSFLVAKYDLISLVDQKIIIYDWKTNLKPIRQTSLEKVMQSRVYPYVVSKEYQALVPDHSLIPKDISLIYWQVNSPQPPAPIGYTYEQYLQDEKIITDLIENISQSDENQFYKTENIYRCSICVYRSFCKRGANAGSLDDIDADLENNSLENLQLDLNSIEEMSF